MKKIAVDWERVTRDRAASSSATCDDVSRALDGTPLDSEAAVVRHTAQLEAAGLIPHTGTTYRELAEVLERDGNDAMIAAMHRQYGPPASE